MKVQHEQLVLLEERCRKMRTMIKDKKKQAKSAVAEENGEPHCTGGQGYMNQDGCR